MINPGLFGYSAGRGLQAAHVAGDASRAQSAARSARSEVSHIEDRLDRLSLVCMAMWSLIQDKTNLTEQELLERVKMIDLMDGVADGKATKTVAKCPKCGRAMSPRHNRCLYCGSGKLIESAFDAV